jgi:outer membrane lipoprotein-sorting protein
MSSKKGDVKIKYVNAIPSRVSDGTFYWKYENNVNQLYFSPTENEEDILRLDNIISGQGGSSAVSNVSLVGIYNAPSSQEQIIIDQNNGTVTSWSDDDWENYMQTITTDEKYGNISIRPFFTGNVIICGSREFICRNSEPVFSKVTIDGVDYYKSKTTGEACVDVDGNKIQFSNTNIPDDVEVSSYNILLWECFGENLSQDLAEKIANFNMELNGSLTINVEEGESEGVYTLSVIIKEQNPLSVITNQQGKKEVVISEDNVEDPTGTQTLMSAAQIKDTINQIIDEDRGIVWENEIGE